MSAGRLEKPVSDGNGGTLDPKSSTNRDFLVALHVKLDDVVIPAIRDLQERMRDQENGDLSRGQKAAILEVVQGDKDAVITRRNMRLPIAALLISFAALLSSIVLTFIVGVPHVG